MKRILASLLGVVLLVTVGCTNMTPREQRALSGGAMGAAGGALFGAIIGGSPAIGAGVGGAVGAAAGALWEDIRQGNARGPCWPYRRCVAKAPVLSISIHEATKRLSS